MLSSNGFEQNRERSSHRGGHGPRTFETDLKFEKHTRSSYYLVQVKSYRAVIRHTAPYLKLSQNMTVYCLLDSNELCLNFKHIRCRMIDRDINIYLRRLARHTFIPTTTSALKNTTVSPKKGASIS